MRAFLGLKFPTWTLNDLDRAFSAWQLSGDKGRFTPDNNMQADHRNKNSDTPPLWLTGSPQLHPIGFGLRCFDWRLRF